MTLIFSLVVWCSRVDFQHGVNVLTAPSTIQPSVCRPEVP